MEKQYLTNLAGSSHVDEGMWDRLKSRGAGGLQRYKGMVGGGWKKIDDAKLDSLIASFNALTSICTRAFFSRALTATGSCAGASNIPG